jgi:predicted phosphoribosyltransferase
LESDIVDQEMREMRKRAKGFTQNLGRKDRQDDSIILVGDGGDSGYFEKSDDGSLVNTYNEEMKIKLK